MIIATVKELTVIAVTPPSAALTLKWMLVAMAAPIAEASCWTALNEPLALPPSS
jgi:hypothetical protein